MGFVNNLSSLCTKLLAKFVIYFLPALIVLSFFVGYFFIPKMYKKNAQKHESKQFAQLCRLVKTRAELFVIDKAIPTAFSLGKSVFVSVGMHELLSRKELEAVLLHELAHIKANSAWHKFSSSIVHVFSPIAWFSGSNCVEHEELMADAFVIKMQGTKKFLTSAKKKI